MRKATWLLLCSLGLFGGARQGREIVISFLDNISKFSCTLGRLLDLSRSRVILLLVEILRSLPLFVTLLGLNHVLRLGDWRWPSSTSLAFLGINPTFEGGTHFLSVRETARWALVREVSLLHQEPIGRRFKALSANWAIRCLKRIIALLCAAATP